MKNLSAFARRVVEVSDDLGVSRGVRSESRNDVAAVAELVNLFKGIKKGEAVAVLCAATRNDRRTDR